MISGFVAAWRVPERGKHSYASWLEEHCVPLVTIGESIGHVDQKTTARYSHIADGLCDECAGHILQDGHATGKGKGGVNAGGERAPPEGSG